MIDFELSQLNELSNAAYMANNMPLACAIDTLADIREAMDNASINSVQDSIDQVAKLESKVTELENELENYKAFFDDCFMRLAGHYSCPSVTSDYDCSVIFDAIELGEANRENA